MTSLFAVVALDNGSLLLHLVLWAVALNVAELITVAAYLHETVNGLAGVGKTGAILLWA